MREFRDSKAEPRKLQFRILDLTQKEVLGRRSSAETKHSGRKKTKKTAKRKTVKVEKGIDLVGCYREVNK